MTKKDLEQACRLRYEIGRSCRTCSFKEECEKYYKKHNKMPYEKEDEENEN